MEINRWACDWTREPRATHRAFVRSIFGFIDSKTMTFGRKRGLRWRVRAKLIWKSKHTFTREARGGQTIELEQDEERGDDDDRKGE